MYLFIPSAYQEIFFFKVYMDECIAMYLKLCMLFQVIAYTERERWRDIFHSLTHSLKVCNRQGWARLTPESASGFPEWVEGVQILVLLPCK